MPTRSLPADQVARSNNRFGITWSVLMLRYHARMVRKLGVRATDTYEMCLLMFFFKTTTLEPYANAVTVSTTMHVHSMYAAG